MKTEIVSKTSALCNIGTWQGKGHSPLDTVRVFGQDDGSLLVGFTRYVDPDILEIPEHMNRHYKNYQAAFSAVGAMLDALERGDYLKEVQARIDAEESSK